MNGELPLDEFLRSATIRGHFFVPAYYDHALIAKNRKLAAELIVPWLNVMAACVALLFTFIIGMLLNCLRKIINGDYLPEDEHINDIQSEFLLENTFVTEPGSRSISTRRTTYPCLLE